MLERKGKEERKTRITKTKTIELIFVFLVKKETLISLTNWILLPPPPPLFSV